MQEEKTKKEEIQESKEEIEKDIVEIQGTILPQQNYQVSEEEFFSVLRTLAPGTNFRTALDGALKTGKGALLVVENENLLPVIDGGFRVNCRFTPQRLIELTKMDGAIIVSKDVKRINYANVILTPNIKIKTNETGTRHKAAERTAKQIGTLVVAISERKNEITLFYKNLRYHLKNTDELLRKANEHIQLIEKQRELFDKHVHLLTQSELRNYESINHAVPVVQKGRLIQKIAEDIRRYIVELGNEGTLLKTRMKEITAGVEKETNLVIRDYTKLDTSKSRVLLDSLTYDEILDAENILNTLAYEKPIQANPIKGWRILSKTSLSEQEVSQVIKQFGSLGRAIHSSPKNYVEVLGEEKAPLFKEAIDKIKFGN
jgi:diadenylate cyclase